MEADPSNSPQAPRVEPTLHGFHLSSISWPTKKRRGPALVRSKSVGGSVDLLHRSYINTDWALKRQRLKWEWWESKGGFSMWWLDKGDLTLKPKSITDLVMAEDFGVEAAEEITSNLSLSLKRHAMPDLSLSFKKCKHDNKASSSHNVPADLKDGMALQFSMVLSLSPPECVGADLI